VSKTQGRLGRRLRRILLLLPYAIKHPGVSVTELSAKFGIKQQDLLDDLDLVFMCGLPGYGPGDLIDVTLDEDRVFVRMADYFSAPLKLSPAEGLALYAGGAALAELPEMEGADALRRALAKLGRAIGVPEGEGGSGIEVRLEPGPADHLVTLQTALSEGKAVSIEYLSASKGELTSRQVEPWGLIAALGRWYLVGLDHLSGEERMFRIDRVKEATMLDAPVAIPEDFDPDRYRGAFTGAGKQPTMSIEISPGVARWFEDYYPVGSTEGLSDGWSKVELVASGDSWAASLVLRLGSGVRNIQPDSVSESARRLAAAIAATYT
jgi:proteasome accessory factor C